MVQLQRNQTGTGRDASKQVIQDNPELAEELEGLIFAALKEQE